MIANIQSDWFWARVPTEAEYLFRSISGGPVGAKRRWHFCFDPAQGMLSGVIHKGVESGEILAQPPLGGAGRPEGQNLAALVAPCG